MSLTSQKHGKTLAGGRAHDPTTSWKGSSLLLVKGRTYDQPLTTIAINSDEGSDPLSLSRNLRVVSAGSAIYLECSSIIPTRYLVLGITSYRGSNGGQLIRDPGKQPNYLDLMEKAERRCCGLLSRRGTLWTGFQFRVKCSRKVYGKEVWKELSK